MTEVTAEDIINKARELIERDGWIQKSYRTDKGRCISGALRDAAIELGLSIVVNDPFDSANPSTYHQARDLVKAKTGGLLPTWNDKGGCTKEDVIAALSL